MTPPEKRTLRTNLRAQRRAIAAARDLGADARALTEHVLTLLAASGVGPGDPVTLYDSTPVEPPTGPLRRALAAAGIPVLLPITLVDLDLDWFLDGDPEQSPLGKDAIARARLVLAPGLAVDSGGGRLGQGGGCYDKALPRRAPGTPVHVLLHPGEVSSQALPSEPHDVLVDGVVTADGALLCRDH